MNYKLPFKMSNHQTLEFDQIGFLEIKSSLPDGEYEMIIRPKMRWDTDQMRKYFHGPVLGFVVDQFKVLGHVYTKEDIKQYLKMSFGKTEIVCGNAMPKSMSEYDFKTYTKFLNDINDWCIDIFECELPCAEQIE